MYQDVISDVHPEALQEAYNIYKHRRQQLIPRPQFEVNQTVVINPKADCGVYESVVKDSGVVLSIGQIYLVFPKEYIATRFLRGLLNTKDGQELVRYMRSSKTHKGVKKTFIAVLVNLLFEVLSNEPPYYAASFLNEPSHRRVSLDYLVGASSEQGLNIQKWATTGMELDLLYKAISICEGLQSQHYNRIVSPPIQDWKGAGNA